ncbi:MAG: pilin [Candidatus Saccharimonadales bacterium]
MTLTRRIRYLLLGVVILLSFGGVAATSLVSAAPLSVDGTAETADPSGSSNSANNDGSSSSSGATDIACQAISGQSNCDGNSSGSLSINKIVSMVVNVLTYVVGAVSIVMIIIGGFKFMTSAGDAQKVASARNSIIYALIGLVIVVLAQLIVHFTINTAVDSTSSSSSTTTGQSDSSSTSKKPSAKSKLNGKAPVKKPPTTKP